MKRSTWLGITLAVCIVPATIAGMTGPGGPNYDSLNGLLSDFQQRYGQVTGDEFTVSSNGRITSLTVWGLYYNYSDYTNAPPAQDDFTLRLHNLDAADDPAEAFFYEENIGAGTRVDTGEALFGELTVYQYTFTGLNIPVGVGAYLLSIIDDTTNPAEDGYWHWVSANDEGTSWWRREDEQPPGQESTVNWTPTSVYHGDRAFQLNIVPVPGAVVLGLIGLALARRINRA